MFKRINLTKFFSLFVILSATLTLHSCGSGIEHGSCNVSCNVTTAYAASRDWCVDKAASVHSSCSTSWSSDGINWENLTPPKPPTPTPVDTTPPARPTFSIEQTALNEATLNIELQYDATQYVVYKNDIWLGFPTRTTNNLYTFTDSFLEQSTEYCYSVIAWDAAGNSSEESLQACITTQEYPLKWTTEIRGSLLPATNGDVFITKYSPDNNQTLLQSLDTNGNINWEYSTTDHPPYYATGIIENSSSILFSTSRAIYSFDLSGNFQWNNTDVRSSLPFSDNSTQIYTASPVTSDLTSTIKSFDETGVETWSYETETHIILPIVSVSPDGITYYKSFGSNDIHALDSDGIPKWNHSITQTFDLPVAIGANESIYFKDTTTVLQAIAPDSSLLWSYTVADPIIDIQIGLDDEPYLLSVKTQQETDYYSNIYSPTVYDIYQGIIYALSSNGDLKWKHETALSKEHNILNVRTGVDGFTYLQSENRLIAIDNTGLKRWEYIFEDGVSNLAIGLNGTVYVWGTTLYTFNNL